MVFAFSAIRPRLSLRTFQMLGVIIVKEAYFDKMGGGITEATPSNIFTLETKFKVFESSFYILCCVVNLNEMLKRSQYVKKPVLVCGINNLKQLQGWDQFRTA